MTIDMQDNLQKYSYSLKAAEGAEFSPDFKPDLTPKQMLELGIFGGNYFEGNYSEYPKEWFSRAKLSQTNDTDINFFAVDASQSRQEWIRKGWMSEYDPRGWFQWYCRYYLGRRIPEEDARQIKRWKQMTRHVGQIKAHCMVGDQLCRRRQRQALLHWAYDSRKI